MSDDVGQSLQGNTIRGHLDRGRKRWQRLRCVNGHPYVVQLILRHLLAHCRHQAPLVEDGRAQIVDEPSNIGYRRLCLELEILEQYLDCLGVAIKHVVAGVELKRHAGQGRPQAIVQVAAQTPPLLFAHRDQCVREAWSSPVRRSECSRLKHGGISAALQRFYFSPPAEEEQLLCGFARTLRQTRSSTRNTHGLGQDVPCIRALHASLVCCSQARLRTFAGNDNWAHEWESSAGSR